MIVIGYCNEVIMDEKGFSKQFSKDFLLPLDPKGEKCWLMPESRLSRSCDQYQIEATIDELLHYETRAATLDAESEALEDYLT